MGGHSRVRLVESCPMVSTIDNDGNEETYGLDLQLSLASLYSLRIDSAERCA